MSENFVTAIKQLSKEKNLNPDTVFSAVEAAMASAFKKDELQYANLEVEIDKETGEIKITRIYQVINDDDIEDDEIEVSPERAVEMGHKKAKIGEDIKEKIKTTKNLGRIAAQTTKQVVLQRIREAERNSVHDEFSQQVGELVSGTIIRIDPSKNIIVDIGKAEGLIPQGEQIRSEHYRSGQRVKLYIKDVNKMGRGPQIILSRKSENLIEKLFEIEVPELNKGIVKIMKVARSAGRRTKVAVIATQIGIDPIGSIIGMRGSRIQNIINKTKVSDQKRILEFKNIKIDLNKQLIIKNQVEYKINNTEKTILERMINNPGKTFSREDIGLLIDLDKERSIDVIITRLRKKIEIDPKNPKFLQTIRGAGYVLWIE